MGTKTEPGPATGFTVGLVGFAAVIASLGLLDVLRGRSPLHTPEVLGRGFLGGTPPATGMEWGPVLAYTGVHLVAFLAIGYGLVTLTRGTPRRRGLRYAVYAGFAVAFFFAETSLMLLDPERLALDWGSILFATVGAAIAMGAVLARPRPGGARPSPASPAPHQTGSDLTRTGRPTRPPAP